LIAIGLFETTFLGRYQQQNDRPKKTVALLGRTMFCGFSIKTPAHIVLQRNPRHVLWMDFGRGSGVVMGR